MPRIIAALAACLVSTLAVAREAPDEAAIREATRLSTETNERWVSARSLFHYLRAVLLREQGDAAGATGELKLAALYETQDPFAHDALARDELEAGDLRDAQEEARQALELARDDAPTLALLGRIETARGWHTQASSALHRALAVDPQNVEALATLVDLDLSTSHLAEAKTDASKLVAIASRADALRQVKLAAGQACGEVAEQAAAAGDDDTAQALYRRAAELDRTAPRLVALGAFLETRGRTREAAEAYAEAIARSNFDPTVAATAARLYLAAGDKGVAAAYVDAISHLPDATAHHADEALMTLGEAFETRGDLPEAASAYEAAHTLAPARAEPLVAAGRVLEAMRNFRNAEDFFAQVPADDPLRLEAEARAAFCAHERGATTSAKATLERLFAAHPDSALVATRLAELLVDSRHPTEAIDVLRRSFDAAPNAEVAQKLSKVARHADEAPAAVELVARAAHRFANDDALGLEAARLFADAGKLDEARTTARAIVGRHPSDAEALSLLARLTARAGESSSAEALARRALVEKPDDATALATLGSILIAEKQREAGLSLVERARRSPSADAEVWSVIAEARAAAGRRDSARRAWQRVLELAEKDDDTALARRASTALGGSR